MSSEVFIFRSSHRRCSVRIGVLRSFAKFTGKHLCQSLLKAETLLKNRLWHRCFPVNFAIFLRTLFLQTTSGRLLLHFIVFMNFSVNSYQHVHAKTSHVWKSRKVMMTNSSGITIVHLTWHISDFPLHVVSRLKPFLSHKNNMQENSFIKVYWIRHSFEEAEIFFVKRPLICWKFDSCFSLEKVKLTLKNLIIALVWHKKNEIVFQGSGFIYFSIKNHIMK